MVAPACKGADRAFADASRCSRQRLVRPAQGSSRLTASICPGFAQRGQVEHGMQRFTHNAHAAPGLAPIGKPLPAHAAACSPCQTRFTHPNPSHQTASGPTAPHQVRGQRVEALPARAPAPLLTARGGGAVLKARRPHYLTAVGLEQLFLGAAQLANSKASATSRGLIG